MAEGYDDKNMDHVTRRLKYAEADNKRLRAYLATIEDLAKQGDAAMCETVARLALCKGV